jgi:hypothetical protein
MEFNNNQAARIFSASEDGEITMDVESPDKAPGRDRVLPCPPCLHSIRSATDTVSSPSMLV